MHKKRILLTGGSGFVGTHLKNLINDEYEVINIDIRQSGTDTLKYDIRKPFQDIKLDNIDVIVNLAAIHKSPGHLADEYFATNILGAKNICEFAEKNNCNQIIFTSSISVYGPDETEKDEDSLLKPNIPYGMSKTIAEYIHREWQLREPVKRKLSIIRPAVVFGKGEKGNFTRIATALRKKIFVYPGRKDTIKSWIYVKDLCRLIINRLEHEKNFTIFNACYPEKTTTEDICNAFNLALGFKMPHLILPLSILNAGSGILNRFNSSFIRSLGLNPERIIKLVNSTNISSEKLIKSGFQFKYDIVSAIKDWANDCGGDILF